MSANQTNEQPGAASGETLSFQAEVSRLLHLMVHSVYSNKEIFLRELISNAADACEKLRYAAVSNPDLTKGDEAFRVLIEPDKEAGTITISDNGIGMNRDDLIDHLGTIARSGTKAFLDGLSEASDGSALIGQFGVGFYSAFMVAESVTVTSRKAGEDEAWMWMSDGLGSFTVDQAGTETAPARGTRIVLTLKEAEAGFAATDELERIVKAYSAHIPIPVAIASDDEEEPKSVTDGSALWVKSKSGVTEEEYKEFYGHVSGQFDDPALTLHYRAEGRHEYAVLLFVPSMKPFDLFDPSRKGRIKLYVRRVFITDEAEILPAWLRFVRGVIDSEDLPLNLSREMLQSNPVLEAIKKGVVNRILSELEKTAEKDSETFEKVWEAFGAVIKEGLYEDPARRDALLKIARFKTTKSDGKWRSLADYLGDMKENQTKIYFAVGDGPESVLASPHLEGFRARDVEVLLLSDSVDAFWVQTALGYEGKPFQSITQG
ncbi:MAG: molecular chaperone HtpG, partial [Pseudomonadota bacterium]